MMFAAGVVVGAWLAGGVMFVAGVVIGSRSRRRPPIQHVDAHNVYDLPCRPNRPS